MLIYIHPFAVVFEFNQGWIIFHCRIRMGNEIPPILCEFNLLVRRKYLIAKNQHMVLAKPFIELLKSLAVDIPNIDSTHDSPEWFS